MPLVELAEDHLPGGGLQHAGHGDVDGLRDHPLGVVHHHHGAVVQVSHALVVFLALLQNEDPHGLAGQHDGLQRVGQLVDVQHFDAVQLGHLVEVEIVGDDLAVVDLGQFDQLHVHFAHVREVVFHDLHGQVRHLLDALQDVQAAAAAVALHRIGRIGHQLQLAQHELRNHQHAVEETGFGDIGDAAVDDHAGVQNLERFLRALLAAEDAAQGRQVEHVALLGAHHQPHVGHPQQEANLQERQAGQGFVHHQGHQEGAAIPSTEPTAAPIRRLRLTCSRRISKKMMPPPSTRPPKVEIQGDT